VKTRALGRVVFLAGAAAIGLFLWRSNPRDVTLVYSLQARQTAQSLEVDISRGGESIRRAEFRVPEGGARQIAHRVRLPVGEYRLVFRIGEDGAGSPATFERQLRIEEGGTIVLLL
jgi:hypothetical protein